MNRAFCSRKESGWARQLAHPTTSLYSHRWQKLPQAYNEPTGMQSTQKQPGVSTMSGFMRDLRPSDFVEVTSTRLSSSTILSPDLRNACQRPLDLDRNTL